MTRATMSVPSGPVAATHAATAPTAAAAGSVSSHAMATWPATPQCTDATPRPAPAPKTEPVATCVVDSGKPRCDEVRITVAVLVPAAKPCALLELADALAEGLDDPPPAHVGAECDCEPRGENDPERGAGVRGQRAGRDQRERTMPMVFWASLVPWASATIDEETI